MRKAGGSSPPAPTMKKPGWDEYFMKIAEIVKTRADCLRRQVGAVIVKDNRILTTGYNGTPIGTKNCTEGGCRRCLLRHQGKLKSGEKEESCICLHAEQNAIIQASYLGVSTKNAILYCTSNPCSTCAKMIINAGIKKIVYRLNHHDKEGINLLKKAKIKIHIFK